MWTVGEIKHKGKWAFKKNYWKAVAVAFILSLLVGGGGVSSTSNVRQNINIDNGSVNFQQSFPSGIASSLHHISPAAVAGIALVASIIVLAAMCIGIILKIFVFNPIVVGGNSFFTKNLNTNASIRELLSAFDRGAYTNLVKIMFFRDLYTFLWSLLFVIPGVVKSYEYRMIPFLLAEHPDMPMEQAFYESKRLMTGNKWHAFLLDLSFIGWHILSAITLGIVGIFYVSPYKFSSDAVLYETLRYGNGSIVYSQPDPQTVQ